MFVRASCFSVQHIDDQDFNATLQYDQDRVKQDFDTIKGAIDEVFNDMSTNWLRYAAENFDWWIDTNFDAIPPSWQQLINTLTRYMNQYFTPEGKYKWGVLLCGKCTIRENRLGWDKGMHF